jgi:hypothetical protein
MEVLDDVQQKSIINLDPDGERLGTHPNGTCESWCTSRKDLPMILEAVLKSLKD